MTPGGGCVRNRGSLAVLPSPQWMQGVVICCLAVARRVGMIWATPNYEAAK